MSAPVFGVGTVVWYPHCGMTNVRKTCPVCFGKRQVTVILGDDSLVDTPCDYCGKGYDGPRGYEMVYEYAAKAYSDYITEVHTTTSNGGQKHEYRLGDGRSLSVVFATEAEALSAADEGRREHEAEQEQRRKFGKEQSERSFSWHVGYHGREAKDARRRLEYHEAHVQPCRDGARIERAKKRAAQAVAEKVGGGE